MEPVLYKQAQTMPCGQRVTADVLEDTPEGLKDANRRLDDAMYRHFAECLFCQGVLKDMRQGKPEES